MRSSSLVQVLICTSVTDAQLTRIGSASPRIGVTDVGALIVKHIPEALRDGQLPALDRSGGLSLDEAFARAEVVLAARRMPPDTAARSPHLRWVQLPLSGIEWFRATDLWSNPRVTLTNTAGVIASPVAEWVLTTMLVLNKNVRRMFELQRSHQWERWNVGNLRGQTVGVIGYGAIGREVARLSEAFGMRVLATKRRITPKEHLPAWVYPQDQLEVVLGQSDYVVIAVPATPATAGLIGAKQLAAMKSSTFLINIARGDVVDEPALLEVLRAKRIAGAGLDVFLKEPLPPSSPLWDLPNVFMSSHVAGLTDVYDDGIVDLFVENLRCYLEGKPLKNIVDRTLGY